MNIDNIRSLRKELILEPLAQLFSVCKVADYSMVNLEHPFCFIARTDEEK